MSIFSMLRRSAPTPAPVEPLAPFPYIVRDSLTHNIIARGSRAKCEDYVNAFGMCYVDTCK